VTFNDKICWTDTFDIKLPDGKIFQAFTIFHDSPINYDEKPVLIVKKRDLWPFKPLSKPIWVLIDPIKKELIKTLPRKPSIYPPGLRKYKDPVTGEKRPIILCADTSAIFCHGCKKVHVEGQSWDKIQEFHAGRKVFSNHFNSDGDLVVMINVDPPVIFHILTHKKFELHDYCTKECRKRAKNIRRLNKRFQDLSKKYDELQDDERPDGHCKVCGKDLSDKRAGALTCGPAHRQQYKRKRTLKDLPLPAPSSSLSLQAPPSEP